jgi:hypothetical protein
MAKLNNCNRFDEHDDDEKTYIMKLVADKMTLQRLMRLNLVVDERTWWTCWVMKGFWNLLIDERIL